MAKLVKLTSTDERVNSDNGFRCQCDDDIIIPPQAKVSLLNAHISSGLLSNYTVNNLDTVGGTTGEILGNLTLNSARTRDVIVPAGDYSIYGICDATQKAFNRSLLYKSTSQTISTTSNTLLTPAEPDFGLQVGCGLVSISDGEHVQIKYNSKPQATNGGQNDPITYTNYSAGITINNGVVSYGGVVPPTLLLDVGSADNAQRTVRTDKDPTPTFAIYDEVNLTGPGIQPVKFQIEDINVVSTLGRSLDLIAYNPAFGNAVKTVASYNTATGLPFAVGDDVSLDDGTGTFATPSGSMISGNISAFAIEPVNANYKIQEPDELLGLTVSPAIAIETILALTNGYQMLLPVPYANAADYNLVVGALFHVIEAGTGRALGSLSITQVIQPTDPAKTSIQLSALTPAVSDPINTATWESIQTLEVVSTNAYPGQTLADTVIQNGDIVHYYNTAGDVIFEATVSDISYANDVYTLKFGPGSIHILHNGAFITGIVAYNILVSQLATLAVPTVKVILGYAVATESITVAGGMAIVDTDAVQLEDPNFNILIATCDAAPYDYKQHAIIPLLIQGADPAAIFINWTAFMKSLFTNEYKIYKTNANKRLVISLINLTGALTTTTRIWPGVGITGYADIQLIGGGGQDLRLFDTMIKGDNIPAQPDALAVEDHILANGCGRIGFLVNDLGACEFGFIQQQSVFKETRPVNGDIRIKIVQDGPGFKYQVWRGARQLALKVLPTALVNDLVIVQWGTGPADTDFLYNDTISSISNYQYVINNINTCTELSDGGYYEEDRGNILFSIVRFGQAQYQYMGMPTTNPAANANPRLKRTYPYSPRANPYLTPPKFNQDVPLHAYIAPNAAEISITELTGNPLQVSVSGVVKELEGQKVIFDETMHTQENPELINEPSKFTAPANLFDFVFDNNRLQRLLGFKQKENSIIGLSGYINATVSYIKAYLPENVLILIDTLPNVQTYDCGKLNGQRRSIIAAATNTQGPSGEINIEPSNLYRINIGNKDPINMRRITVSFEDFFGNKLILQNARAVVNLLFEP